MKSIIFTAQDIQALKRGKTQFRVPIKVHRSDDEFVLVEQSNGNLWPYRSDGSGSVNIDGREIPYKAPYKLGEQIFVKETFNTEWCDKTIYRADGESARAAGYTKEPAWRSSVHMKQEHSRYTLEITGVKVQRVQDISEDEAKAEGVVGSWLDKNGQDVNAYSKPTFKQGFLRYWRNRFGDESVDNNDWCFAYTFKEVK